VSNHPQLCRSAAEVQWAKQVIETVAEKLKARQAAGEGKIGAVVVGELDLHLYSLGILNWVLNESGGEPLERMLLDLEENLGLCGVSVPVRRRPLPARSVN